MPTQPTTRTTSTDVIRLAAGLPPRPPRPEPEPEFVVSRLTSAIHRLTDLGANHISTACGLHLPQQAVDPFDRLLHDDAHECAGCEVSA